jgi:ornithine cyclodeaminase/alanine dehydrogenase-like protein (mu-crystallin family)
MTISEIIQRLLKSPNAFILSDIDVNEAFDDSDYPAQVKCLVDEIDHVYKDSSLKSYKRGGWSEYPDAHELMGCKSTDFTCAKYISSVPGGGAFSTVGGMLFCMKVGPPEQVALLCDATYLTPLRTAASTAAVMRRVTPKARSLGIVGTGVEGTAHAIVLSLIIDSVDSIHLYDLERDQMLRSEAEIQFLLDKYGKRAPAIHLCDAETDVYDCDALVTATFADQAALTKPNAIMDGTFIAAVGADLEKKRELPDELYLRSKFIADDLRQCLKEGELQYASELYAGESAEDHRGELCDGRIVSAATLLEDADQFLERDAESVIIYDSTGFSGQDLAVARVLLALISEAGYEPQRFSPHGPQSFAGAHGFRDDRWN